MTSEPVSDSEDADEVSGYEDEDATASAVSSPPNSESDSASEAEPSSDDEAPRKKRRVGGKKDADIKKIEVKTNGEGAVIGSKGQELWRPGVKSKLAPGEAVFVPLPKAREEGKIKYRDDWIHGNTMLFLGELKRNNDREWLKVHDADYRQSKKDFDSFVECLTEKVIEKDETIPELPAKDLVCLLLYLFSSSRTKRHLIYSCRHFEYTETYASAQIPLLTRYYILILDLTREG